jgi:endonuclease YncB( thermonuclease family)
MDQAPQPALVNRPPAWLPPALHKLWPHRRLVLASAVTAALAIGIGGGFLAIMGPMRNSAPVAERPTQPTPVQAGKPRQTVVLQPPLVFKVKSVPVATDDTPAASGFKPPLMLKPPYQLLDSTTFRSGNTTIRLAFLSGLRRDELCRASNGQRYACGLRGRASLARLTSGKPLTCWPVFGSGSGAAGYRCFADKSDIGAEQAQQGYARPLSPVFGYRQGEPLESPTADIASPELGDSDPLPDSVDEPEH